MVRSVATGWLASGAAIMAQSAFAQGGDDRYYGHHMWDGGWWMFLGPLWMIVFIAAIVAVVVLLVRWLGGASHGALHTQQPPTKSPVDILKERFARGEIDKEEFEERRRLLE